MAAKRLVGQLPLADPHVVEGLQLALRTAAEPIRKDRAAGEASGEPSVHLEDRPGPLCQSARGRAWWIPEGRPRARPPSSPAAGTTSAPRPRAPPRSRATPASCRRRKRPGTVAPPAPGGRRIRSRSRHRKKGGSLLRVEKRLARGTRRIPAGRGRRPGQATRSRRSSGLHSRRQRAWRPARRGLQRQDFRGFVLGL